MLQHLNKRNCFYKLCRFSKNVLHENVREALESTKLTIAHIDLHIYAFIIIVTMI